VTLPKIIEENVVKEVPKNYVNILSEIIVSGNSEGN